ncbi:uncharacterized protein LOC144155154 [Haemaphysalis longicornis]
MHSQMPAYVASCEVCQQYKRIHGRQPGLLSPIPPPETVFHTIGIGHVGPLSTTAGGNRYIIVGVDYLPKYVEEVAGPSLAASPVIDFLKAGVELHFSSPYHPQMNGLTERTNQTIHARLAPYVKTNKAGETILFLLQAKTDNLKEP